MIEKINPGARDIGAGVGGAIHAIAGRSAKIPYKRTHRQHHETSDTYSAVVARLDENWRVIICKDRLQWILQRRDAERSGQKRWRAVGYFLTREALIRVSRTVCAGCDATELAMLDSPHPQCRKRVKSKTGNKA